MPSALEIVLQFQKKLDKKVGLDLIDTLGSQALVQFVKQKNTLKSIPGKNGLTPKRVSALQKSISLNRDYVIKRSPTGFRISLGIGPQSDDAVTGVHKWAVILNDGGKNHGVIKPLAGHKYLAIPFTTGGHGIEAFGIGKPHDSIVKQFIESNVKKGKDGRPMLRNSKGRTPIIMSGMVGRGWEPIATLVTEVVVPTTRWADNFLYNVIKSLKVNL